MGKKQVPAIRFQGFTDAWEQRKLGDIYIERNERGNAELDILSVSIHHGISQNELDTDELGKSVRRSDDKSLYKHVYYGDLVFNMMRAWQGAIGVVKNEGMVSPAYISAIPDDSVFPEFMDYCLRRKCIINQINNLSYGVTDFRKRLYWEPFTRVTIMMPSVDEQRKITDIFRQLDDLITLHQRKYEKLLKVKKSMLEKMFPRDGADVPEIRFDGFTDAWEQRKLGELLEFHNGFNGSSEKYGRGIPLISVMDILSNDFITSENIRIKADLTEKEFQRFKVGYGDVLFQRSSENVEDAGTSNVYLDERKCAVFGGFVICGKKKAEYVSLFLKYGLTNKGVRAQITSKAQGAQHINVSQDTLQGTVILLPSQYEQEKIGNYFRYLDALITLHQRKYNWYR